MSIVDRWNAAYFGNRLAPDVLAALEPLNEACPDAQALADRSFRLMRRARFGPRDFSAHTAQVMGAVHTSVPSAWDGAVPPITLPGRHRKLDDYIAGNPWHQPGREPVLLDLGCGFPPLTALDSAAALTGWQVIGVDPCFDRYFVHDGDHYACFDDDQRLRYLRTGTVHPDTAPARAHFHDAFRSRFDERLDALLAENGICRRRPDGYLGVAADGLSWVDLDDSTAAMAQRLDSEGFVDDAVTVLGRAGRRSWRNAAGHIATQPISPRPLAPRRA